MFKRIALLAVTAGALALPAAAKRRSSPAPTPLKSLEVKWILGPTGHDGSGAAIGYETRVRRPDLPAPPLIAA